MKIKTVAYSKQDEEIIFTAYKCETPKFSSHKGRTWDISLKLVVRNEGGIEIKCYADTTWGSAHYFQLGYQWYRIPYFQTVTVFRNGTSDSESIDDYYIGFGDVLEVEFQSPFKIPQNENVFVATEPLVFVADIGEMEPTPFLALQVRCEYSPATLEVKEFQYVRNPSFSVHDGYMLVVNRNGFGESYISRELAVKQVGAELIHVAENALRWKLFKLSFRLNLGREHGAYAAMKWASRNWLFNNKTDFHFHDVLTLNLYNPKKFVWMVYQDGTNMYFTEADGKFLNMHIQSEPGAHWYYWNGFSLQKFSELRDVLDYFNTEILGGTVNE